MILSVTTNIVAALAITTAKLVPCECPDNIPGCCTLHTREVKETRYVPVKVDEHYKNNPNQTRGVAISEEALSNAVFWAYPRKSDIPDLISVRIFFDDPQNNGNHPIGFIIKDALFREIERNVKNTEGVQK